MKRERKHVRLRNFDYSSEGAYFITICTKNREHYLGDILVAGTPHMVSQRIPFERNPSHRNSGPPPEMELSEIGKIAFEYLNKIPDHFPNTHIDEFIIMPNHIHCILVLFDSEGTRRVVSLQPLHHPNKPDPKHINEFSKSIHGSVSVIIQQFKSSVKRWCNKNGYAHFQWQPRFHERVIRDITSYKNIKNYIIENPLNWEKDSQNK